MIGSPFVTSSGVALNNIRSLTGGFVSSGAGLQSPRSLKMWTFSSNNERICSSFLRRSSGIKKKWTYEGGYLWNITEYKRMLYTRGWSPRISLARFSCCFLSSSVSLGTPSSSSFSLATHKYTPQCDVQVSFSIQTKLTEDLFEKHNSLTATLKELGNCFPSELSTCWENLTQEFTDLWSFLSTLFLTHPTHFSACYVL